MYCHLGSQVAVIEGYEAAARRLVAFMAKLGQLPELNLGVGYGVACGPGDHGLDVAGLSRRVSGVVRRASAAYGIPVTRLALEAGRAIAGGPGWRCTGCSR